MDLQGWLLLQGAEYQGYLLQEDGGMGAIGSIKSHLQALFDRYLEGSSLPIKTAYAVCIALGLDSLFVDIQSVVSTKLYKHVRHPMFSPERCMNYH